MRESCRLEHACTLRDRRLAAPRSRYFFASTLPSSTAGWSKASTPSRCAAMIVSSMKCISNSPRLPRRACRYGCVRTGQPFFASVSAVARPSRRDQIADGLAGEIRLAGELARARRRCAGRCPARVDGDDGEQLVARAGDDRAALGCAGRPARAPPTGVVPLPSLPRLSAQSCTYQCVKRSSRSA